LIIIEKSHPIISETNCRNMRKKGETDFGYSPEEYKKFKNYAWRFLVLFSLLYMAIYCCRLNLSSAAPVMIAQLGWTSADIGILTSVLFWAYGIGQLVSGRLSEIFGPNRFIILSVVLTILCNFFISLQNSFVPIAVFVAINGFVQSMAWPSGLAILARWWPGKTRGFASGVTHAFSGFGQACATLAVTLTLTICGESNWKANFVVPSLLPLVILIAYCVLVKSGPSDIGLAEYREDNAATAAAETEMKHLIAEKGKLYPYRYLLGNRKFCAWLIISFITGVARYGLTTWVPLYFIDGFGVDVTHGLLQSLALPVGMGIGTLVVPVLTDKFCPTNRMPAVILSSLAATGAIAALLLIDPTTTSGTLWAWVLLFISGFAIYAVDGLGWTYAIDVGGRVFTGTCSGILNFSAYIGAAVQSMIYGFIATNLGWGMVFGSMAFFCLLITFIGLKFKK